MKKRIVLLTLSGLALIAHVDAAEYFVGKQGDDGSDGLSKKTAFLTIRKGAGALSPGDTLTIGPGEYFENIKLIDLGDIEKETLIRAEIPGTVLLRGDRDADLDFRLVPGRRFVYVADCEGQVLSVLEVDTLKPLAAAADAVALEFGPGRYFHDRADNKLYLSSSNFEPPSHHCYALGTLKGDGFLARGSRRVVFDGLAARGFSSPVEKAELCYPISGFMLRDCERCVVRRGTAFLNESGVTVNNENSEGGNVVEFCRLYGNGEGVVGYNPSGETFRDSHCFLNGIYGARFYGTRKGDKVCLFSRLMAWGNPGGDYWFKGKGLSDEEKYAAAEQCVAFKDCHIRKLSHCVKGERNHRGGDHPDTVLLPEGRKQFLEFVDREFADPLNLDFRPQSSATIRQSGEDRNYKGPHPYKPNVRYVSPTGDDQRDGLSMADAWRTLGHAVKSLRPGDTLYLAGGRYSLVTPLMVKKVSIRGRGMDTPIIEGPLTAADCEDLSFERLHLSGPVRVANGKNVRFGNCVFSGGKAVEADNVRGLSLTHGLLTVPLELTGCSEVDLRGNLFAASPAVRTDELDAVEYSSYNSYSSAEACWEAGGNPRSRSELRERQHDLHSRVIVPELSKTDDAVRLENAYAFVGRGPLGTAIGPYREWRPQTTRLIGPFVHSVTDTTANVEWWTTLPAEVELGWGDTPECTNKARGTQASCYSHSMVGLEPETKYYARAVLNQVFAGADPAYQFVLPEQTPAVIEFTTAAHPPASTTRYVSNGGDDGNDGSTRETAWKTLQHAADRARPGDTVLVAGGEYPGTVYFRATGAPDRPITLKAIPGEKVTIDGLGERLKVGFVLYGKSAYRFDSLYFKGFAGIPDNRGGAECGAILVRGGSDLQITRCHFSYGWGPGLAVELCPDILVRNCVFMHSMSATSFSRCPGLRIENNVFISPLIFHLLVGNRPGESFSVDGNIFGENTRGKVHVPFTAIGKSQSNNCFYTRWPEQERKVIAGFGRDGITLPEYRAQVKETDSFVANPQMPGAVGFRQGWQQIPNYDFNGLFATHPMVVKRGIGLEPEAFRGSHFWKEDWPFDAKWAEAVLARLDVAEALVAAGKEVEALVAYVKLAEEMPMGDRLKSDVLERAAMCANRLRDYEQAVTLAKRIPLKPLAIRRQMAFMAERGKFTELLEAFADRPGSGTPHLSWFCPETEELMADALYYRAIAYAETGDLKKAEKELRTMVDKGKKLGYSPGPTILDLSWKRLGDFYRVRLKDDVKALEAYGKVIDRETVFHHDRPMPKPILLGNSEVLAAAAEAACGILRRQGKEDGSRKIRVATLKAQAEALAFLWKRDEALTRFGKLLTVKGALSEDLAEWEKRITKLPGGIRGKLLEQIAATTPLAGTTRQFLLEATGDGRADMARIALHTVLAFAPAEKLEALLTGAEEEARKKAILSVLEPKIRRMRELAGEHKYPELLEQFRDTDLASWQDKVLAAEALLLRGQAYANGKDGKKAEADLNMAAKLAPGDARCWYELAGNYQANLGDSSKAIDAYLKAHELAGVNYNWFPLDIALKTAALLRQQGRNEEALKILKKYDVSRMAGAWKGHFGRALRELGEEGEQRGPP